MAQTSLLMTTYNVSPFISSGKLLDFIDTKSPQSDIFFFQELNEKIAQFLNSNLNGYRQYFVNNNYLMSNMGLLILIKKEFRVDSYEHFQMFSRKHDVRDRDKKKYSQILRIFIGDKSITTVNVHLPVYVSMKGKLDSLTRLAAYLDSNSSNFQIIGGDFNVSSLIGMNKPLLAHINSLGYQNDHPNMNTHRIFGIPQQLDYIFCKGDCSISTANVLKNIKMSDHFPLDSVLSY